MPKPNPDLLAASLRANEPDTEALVEALAAKLESALPRQTTIARKRSGLFAKGRRTRRISVHLGNETYSLTVQGDRAYGRCETTIGGTLTKSRDLNLAAWIDSLSQCLAEEAERSEATKQALERFLD